MPIKDVMKGGWHPTGKDGKSKESWRGDFKGIDQVAGWMGKGKKSEDGSSEERIAQPIHTLKDPATFGPPPKRGSASNTSSSGRSGLGAPQSHSDLRAQREAEEEEARQEEEARKPPPPPVPYRANRTGLKTDHLPPPPGRYDREGARSDAPPPKPKLPPRLPPRQNTSPAPPSYDVVVANPPEKKSYLNQGSLNRLGAAGISVPGFGIGNKPTPPPSRNSTSSSIPTTNNAAPSASNGQLGELQSRFSRLGNSSPAPKPDAPAQGTSFAQKQAAIRTASQFRNDPSSVSFSDAKTAASTANNFRERHGEQVAAGARTANNMNQKYGIANKFSSFAGNIPMQQTQSAPEPAQVEVKDNSTIVKKKPPPPPVKRAALAFGADTGSGPPPIPLSSKPKFDTNPPPRQVQTDLPLDLDSLWFAQTPIAFPPKSINDLPGKRMVTYSTSWTSSGLRKTMTFTGAIRHNSDFSTHKIRLTWDSNNPRGTVKAEQKYIPPPRPLTAQELEDYRRRYSDRVAAWCESKMGQQVGNGECWTLANEALKAIAEECKSQNQEPPMSSQSYVHGALIYEYLPPQLPNPPGGVLAAGVARGDVIQYLSAHFKMKNGGQSWAGAPDHTAVVTGVERYGRIRIVQSNSGGVKTVQEASVDFEELVAGEIRIFRAVGVNWVGELSPTW